jgi:predicted AlkP superfamily phosphohydrolase/phosphomutase
MNKVAFVGIDGGDLTILEKIKKNGHIDNRLIDSLMPVDMSSNIDRGWVTIFTGRDASHSNGFYWRIDGKTYSLTESFNASMYNAPPIWEKLLSESKKVGLIGIPTTSPVKPLDGVMIAAGGGGVNILDCIMYYPKEIGPLLDETGYIFDLRFPDFVGKKSIDFINRLLMVEKKRLQILKKLNETYKAIIFWGVVFKGFDIIQHFFWDRVAYLAENRQTRDSLDETIVNYYNEGLSIVLEIISMFDPGTVVVASDHGFAGHEKNVHIVNLLSVLGLIKPRKEKLKKKIKRIAIDYLPDSIKPRLRVLQRKIQMGGVWKLTAPDCIWEESTVVPFKGLNGLYLNSEDHFAEGHVDSSEADFILKKIEECLIEIRDEDTGQKVFQNVHRNEQEYEGPLRRTAPDIIFDLPKGYYLSTDIEPSGIYVTTRNIKRTNPSHLPGQGHIGIHASPACYAIFENGSLSDKQVSKLSELYGIMYNACE